MILTSRLSEHIQAVRPDVLAVHWTVARHSDQVGVFVELKGGAMRSAVFDRAALATLNRVDDLVLAGFLDASGLVKSGDGEGER